MLRGGLIAAASQENENEYSVACFCDGVEMMVD